MSGFAPTHGCAINCEAVRSNVFDLQTNHIAASELAIDSEIEHGEVAPSPLDLQLYSEALASRIAQMDVIDVLHARVAPGVGRRR